jgi:hypothetical protein
MADDDANQRLLIKHVMGQEGYRIIEAENGRQCLAQFAEHLPHLVLLDVVMPEMDGITCCTQIKALPHAEHVPILMITGLEDEASVLQSFQAGAADYISKPIFWPVLKQRIRRLIEASQDHQQVQSLIRDLEHKVQERTAQLATQIEELQELDRLKDDFLATISHELRTPLTTIQMALHMITTIPNEEKKRRYFHMAIQQCDKEIALVNKLLDLQRLDANAYFAHPVLFELRSSLLQWLEITQVRAAEHHLCFQLDLPENSILLTSDPSILEQILRELLDNACKYTRPEGVVQVQVHPHPQHLEISIGNTATIDPKGLSRLFDKFYRAQQTDPWRYQGTGLGLALVKRLVKRLQGEISVSSHENWTIFTLRIPYQLTA